MAWDILIFIAILVPTSLIVYKLLKTLTKVLYWGVAIFIAYIILKLLVL